MELREFWRALSRHWVAALLAFAVCAAGVGYAAFSPADEYRASATVSVEPATTSGASPGDVQVVTFLMPALQAEVGTAAFEQSVRGSLSPDLARAHYQLTSTVESGTGLLTMTVQSSNRGAVAPIANAYAGKLIDSSSSRGLTMRVLSGARQPSAPSGPHRLAILVSGLVLALLAAVLAALLAHAAHRRRSRGEEIRDTFGLTVLGEIPAIRRMRGTGFAQLLNRGDDPAVEALVRLRTNVELALVRHRVPTICVTSQGMGEGKSTISGTLSYALAAVGHGVTLIEGDLRRPSLAAGFPAMPWQPSQPDEVGVEIPVDARPGAHLVLVSAEAVREVPTFRGQVAGAHPADTVATVLPDLLRAAGSSSGLTVVDAPPITAAETKLIVSLSRWAVIVVDAHRRESLDQLESTVTQVREAGGEILGVVLNRARLRRSQRQASQYRAVQPRQQGRGPARPAAHAEEASDARPALEGDPVQP